MSEELTQTIELVGGHVDRNGVRHTRVVYGHRVTARELFDIDESPQGQVPTQYNDLVVRSHIVEFGTLKMPVPLKVLLDLDSIDREDLTNGCNEYQLLTAQDRVAEFLPNHEARLGWGFRSNDIIYDRVRFGCRLTGVAEVEADRAGLKAGIRRTCFLIGRQITKLFSSDGTAELDGPIPVDLFESLDGADVATLRGAAELWRQSFRVSRAQLSNNGRGEDGPTTGDENRLDRRTNSCDARSTT